jgi:hypothetical protein
MTIAGIRLSALTVRRQRSSRPLRVAYPAVQRRKPVVASRSGFFNAFIDAGDTPPAVRALAGV